MKLKKRVIILSIAVLILTLILSTNVFAVVDKSKTKNKSDNKVSNEVTNTVTDDSEENVEEETENEVENETSNTTSKSNKSSKSSITKKLSKNNVINEDIVNTASEETVEYKNSTINGNMFVTNSNKIVLDDVKVDGDIILIAEEIEIVGSEIEGSAYIAANKIVVSETDLNSVYFAGNNIEIIRDTNISRELRVAGSDIKIDAEVGRDAYIYGKNVEFGDEAEVSGKAIVRAEKKTVSEDADINNLNYEKTKYPDNININTNMKFSIDIMEYLISKSVEIGIILIIAIFILYGFPKFSEVNSCLRIRDFIKALFTGILEVILVFAIVVGLFFTGYGIGYGLILLNLLIVFVILGKVIFIISFAVRMSCKPERVSKFKAFFATIFVAVVLGAIEMITLLGIIGFIIDAIINIILAFVGFGSMFRVILTSKKKMKKLGRIKNNKGRDKEEILETNYNETENAENKEEKSAGEELKEEIQAEVKEEIKEETEELKAEHEEEKKIEENVLKDDEKAENIDSENKDEEKTEEDDDENK